MHLCFILLYIIFGYVDILNGLHCFFKCIFTPHKHVLEEFVFCIIFEPARAYGVLDFSLESISQEE